MIDAIREPDPPLGGDPRHDLPATSAHEPGSAPSGVAWGLPSGEGPGAVIGP